MLTHTSYPNWLQSLHHDGSANYVSKLYPQLGETVQVRLRMAHDAPVTAVYLRTFPDGEQMLAPLQQAEALPPVQWWQGDLKIDMPVVHYRFVVHAVDGIWFYAAAGPVAHLPLDRTDFRILAGYHAPEWVHSSVFYQIFPDRFHNGDPATNPRPDEYEFRGQRPETFPWGELPPEGHPHSLAFYGGDLPGISEKLDYLQHLGINAIYLNPIFTAYTSHKYDVADYFHVDPHFGGDEALAALRQALDARNMRYLLDIVPNHCGFWHPWFQTARQDSDSPEAGYFTFYEHPDKYAQWLTAWILPKLNYTNSELRNIMYEGDEAAFRKWLRPPYAADGWRVDVANMLGRQGDIQINEDLARAIYTAAKETRADAYMMAENFFDATESLQDGGQWDGVMNYAGFAYPLYFWLNGVQIRAMGLQQPIAHETPWPTAVMATAWRQHLAAIPWSVALQQFNLLGSHDTPRLRTLMEGDDALQRLLVTLLMTYPGVPSIYYGDEVGLMDVPVLQQRACMPWDEAAWNHDLLAFYRQVIRLRRETVVLQTGGFQMLLVDTDTFAFQREGVTQRAVVIAHRGETARPAGPLPVTHGGIPDGTRFAEFFTSQEAMVTDGALQLPEQPRGAAVWLQNGPNGRNGIR